MKKVLITLSVCLNVLALLVLAAVFCSTEFRGNLGAKPEQTTHEITDPFQNVLIDVDTSDVTVLPSADGTCKVVCTETKAQNHRVTVRDDTLMIDVVNSGDWLESLFSFGAMSVEIYLPQSRYAALRFESDTGNLEMPGDFLFASAELEVDTGDILWQADVSGKLSVSADTGDVTLSDCLAGMVEVETDTGNVYFDRADGESIRVETDTGNVYFDRADGESIRVETDTGNVTGTVATEKLFRGVSDTGRVNVPWDTRGGDCIVFTDTGNIELSVAQ